MSEDPALLLVEDVPAAEPPAPEVLAEAPAEPEAWPPPPRMIDGFLEILAYTRYLVTGSTVEPVDCAEAGARLRTLLDRAESFRSTHGFPEESWAEALFAVCAWVDEQLLTSEWDGRFAWLTQQLQRQEFGTTRGGESFFERLEALPEEAVQVREVYDYCLSLGFQGRHFTEPEQLRRIRAAQLGLLPRGLGAGNDPHLFPEAGQTLPGELSRRQLPYRYLVYLLLAAIPPALFLIIFLSFRTFLDNLVRPLLQ